VTDKVCWSEADQRLLHDDAGCGLRILSTPASGYRMRKVRLWTVQPSTNIIGLAQDAFIVEKART